MDFWNGVMDLTRPLGAVQEWLASLGAPDWVIFAVAGLAGALGIFLLVALSNIIMVYGERRILGRFQIRFGPNRVGWEGTLQLIADALKGVGKETIIPSGADKPIYLLGPIVAFLPAFLGFAVFTFGPSMVPVNMDISLLYFQAVTSLAAFALFMAGWSSNNKFALFGAMRAVAQFVSYEVPLVLAMISVVLVTGTMNTLSIANMQFVPYVLVLPLAFLVFCVASLAEMNRTPMDIIEAESEIVAGYHTEYGGMAFTMFYAAEYTHMLAFGAMVNIMFLGGWKLFWLDQFLPPWLLFILKAYLVFFVLIWLRASLPRMRIDQLMQFGWKVLVPIALAGIILTAIGMLIPGVELWAVTVLNWAAVGAIALWQLSKFSRSTTARDQRNAARNVAIMQSRAQYAAPAPSE